MYSGADRPIRCSCIIYISRECMDYGPATLLPSLSLRSPVTLRIHEYRVPSLPVSHSIPCFHLPILHPSLKKHPAVCSFNFADRGVVFSLFSRIVEILNPRSGPLFRFLFFFSFSFFFRPFHFRRETNLPCDTRVPDDPHGIVSRSSMRAEYTRNDGALRSDDKPISRAGCRAR